MEDGKSAGGKGRLTDDVIDKMQTYYGMAIRSNLPNVQAMSTATKTILQHSVRPFTPSQRRPWPGDLKGKKAKKVKEGEKQLTKEEWEEQETERLEEEKIRHELCYTTVEGQHHYCPWGEETWCKWHKLQQEKEKEKEEKEKEKEKEDEKEKDDEEHRGGRGRHRG